MTPKVSKCCKAGVRVEPKEELDSTLKALENKLNDLTKDEKKLDK